MGLFSSSRKRKSETQFHEVGFLSRSTNYQYKVVKIDNTPLHIKRGWTSKKNKHEGYYRTSYGAWKGEIILKGDKFEVFIFKPPTDQLKKHSRWACLKKVKSNKYQIKLAVQPIEKDIGAIIYYVEKVIIESFRK